MMTDDEKRMLDYCRNAMDSQKVQHERDIRHLEQRISDLEKLMESKFEAREKATKTAQMAQDARFESVNEFRATLSDQTKHFVTREVMDANVRDLSRRLSDVENKIAGYDGRIVGYSAGSALIVLILSIVAQILNLGG